MPPPVAPLPPPATPAEEAAWDVSDVCRFLKLRKPETVLALVKANRLPAVRLGRRWRFSPDAVRAFLRGESPGKVDRKRKAGEPEWMRGVERVIRR